MAEIDRFKACPFCKGPPEISTTNVHYAADAEHEAGSYEAYFTVSCHECGIHMDEEYEMNLLERWNTRDGVAPEMEEDDG